MEILYEDDHIAAVVKPMVRTLTIIPDLILCNSTLPREVSRIYDLCNISAQSFAA